MLKFVVIASLILASHVATNADTVPKEPVDIGTSPQFVFDAYIIDNHWAIRFGKEAVQRVFHQPQKFAGNPVIAGEGGYLSVLRDDETGLFRLWYQTWSPPSEPKKSGRYATAYAESKDGMSWTLPKLGLYEWNGTTENNIVWTGIDERRGGSPFFLDLPKKAKRGYRHVMLYREVDGMHLIGSQDGIHWDRSSDLRISSIHSDTNNSLVYDPRHDRFIVYCRAKNIYRAFRGDMIDTGASRRIACMTNKVLWTEWEQQPQHILIPDELDSKEGFNFFYGMPANYYGGVFWGFLQCFKMNSDIHTELTFSRDGIDFDRLPTRPKFIERGPEGAWDDGMVFSGHQWVEVDDEWWMYYAGWDGPHGTSERTPGIGLIKLRKEGFISMRGPSDGGVLNTRAMIWPGGNLVANVDASKGEFKVRVTDAERKVLRGYDYDDCIAFTGDNVAHEVRWKDATLDSLKGKVIRLEFFLRDADLFTFRARHAKLAAE